MKELFKSKIEIIEFFKKFFIQKRKKELENEPKLLNELNKKSTLLKNQLKLKNTNKNNLPKTNISNSTMLLAITSLAGFLYSKKK